MSTTNENPQNIPRAEDGATDKSMEQHNEQATMQATPTAKQPLQEVVSSPKKSPFYSRSPDAFAHQEEFDAFRSDQVDQPSVETFKKLLKHGGSIGEMTLHTKLAFETTVASVLHGKKTQDDASKDFVAEIQNVDRDGCDFTVCDVTLEAALDGCLAAQLAIGPAWQQAKEMKDTASKELKAAFSLLQSKYMKQEAANKTFELVDSTLQIQDVLFKSVESAIAIKMPALCKELNLTSQVSELSTDNAELTTNIAELTTSNAELTTSNAELTTNNEALTTSNQELRQQINLFPISAKKMALLHQIFAMSE